MPDQANGTWSQLTDYSAFAERCLRLWPQACQALIDQQRLQQAGVADFAAVVTETQDAVESLSLDQLEHQLRCYRQTEALRICWRDVCGEADLISTLSELSRLAEHCLQAALLWHRQDFQRRFGDLEDARGEPFQFSILALGKLGGEELNFSSDIDIMFVHNGADRSSGPRRLYAQDYLTRMAQALSNSLHKVQEGGRVYRVDTRLRPFGDSGALVWSRQAMEQYYVQQGRDWERYALQKARVVAGDQQLGTALLQELQPFIYRRYLDYGLFEGIRGMREDISRQAERLGHREHLKLGSGGIREIEFLVQSLQLLRGGRQPSLRHHNLLTSLQRLQQHDYLDAVDAARLHRAYCELRRLENRLQMRDDRQLHQLPLAADERTQFAQFCAYADWDSLYAQLQHHRQHVSRLFRAQFVDQHQHDTGPAENLFSNPQTLQQQLKLDATDATELQLRELTVMRDQIDRKLVDASAHRRWQQLQPLLLQDASASKAPALALRNALSIIAAIARRSNYLALLLEMPPARKRMVEFCAIGGYMVQALQANPMLLDDLIDPRLLSNLAASASELEQRIRVGINSSNDPEQQLLQLQQWQQSYRFRIAGNELLDQLDSHQARQQLSWLAEAIVRISLDCCRQHSGHDLDLAVIAFGSLGAMEMHYESDLDLVFLYADEAREHEHSATRLVQKLMHWLTSLGGGQRLYQIDTRLRPNGRSGTLVSSLSAFRDYQQTRAWVWEWQSLTRARCVAGSRALQQAFVSIRHATLAPAHAADGIRQAMLSMYQRIATQQRLRPQGFAESRLRIQFLLQYWLLTQAQPDTEIPCNGLQQMQFLANQQAWLAARSQTLRPLWLQLLHSQNQMQLTGTQKPLPADLASQVASIWQQVFADADGTDVEQPL